MIAAEAFEGCLIIDQGSLTSEFFTPLPAGRGVLLFTDSSDRPIQLLSAPNIRLKAKSRLMEIRSEEKTKRTDISQITDKIYYKVANCDFRAEFEHYRLAKDIYPRDWSSHYKLITSACVRIDTSSKWPTFSVTTTPTTSGGIRSFGPFPSRKAASAFAESLDEAFSLCRRPTLADCPEKARSCPYLQMGQCPAPCQGKISAQEYRSMIDDAISAASSHAKEFANIFEKEMKQAAMELDFERAGRLKNRIGALNRLGGNDYKWTGPLEDLCIAHMAPSSRQTDAEDKRKKIQLYALFIITAEHIIDLGDFPLADGEAIEDAISGLRTADHTTFKPQIPISLAARFIFLNSPPGIWLKLSRSDLADTQKLADHLLSQAKFAFESE